MVAPAKFAHVVFRTNQLEAMVDWYCKVLDAHVVMESSLPDGKSISFITYDDEHHRLAFVGSDSFPVAQTELPRAGFYHSAFCYNSLTDLLDTVDRLESLGIKPWRTINHGPTIASYYSDPDGHDVELQVDRFANPDDATDFMRGEVFTANPIGILVDPKELRAKIAAGLPMSEIMRRPDELN